MAKTKSPKKWYNAFIPLCLILFLFVVWQRPLYAQEPQYDLNKIRMKIFHLLNFSPAENTLITPPPGSRVTPTPRSGPGGTTTTLTRIYYLEGATENIIGAGSFVTGTGYRLQLTRQIPLKNKSAAANKYYLWLVKTGTNPLAAQQINLFEAALLPTVDRTFTNNLTDFNELVVTEEDPNNPPGGPTAPNLSVPPIFVATQAIITPTPGTGTPTGIPPTPTPAGAGGSTIQHKGLIDLLGSMFKF